MARLAYAVLLALAAVAVVEAAQCGYAYQTSFPGCADCQDVTITKLVWYRGQWVNKNFTKVNCTACNTGYAATTKTEGGKVIATCAVCSPGYGFSFKAFPTTCVKCTNNTVPLWLESNIKIVKVNGTCASQLRRPEVQADSARASSALFAPKNGAINIPPECKQFVPGTCVGCPAGSTANAAGVTCFAGNGTANATAFLG